MKLNKSISYLLIISLLFVSIPFFNIKKAKAIGEIYTFNYSGETEQWICPETGLYEIEALGGYGWSRSINYEYNQSGISGGNITLRKGDVLYITVGGPGQRSNGQRVEGGYNGGGAAQDNNAGSGGGATMVATKSGLLTTLADNDLILVAGGSAGDSINSNGIYCGSSGGGERGGSTNFSSGGTQDTGYARGKGQDGDNGSGGGGGGYYGGTKSSSTQHGAGGGSGYINQEVLNNSYTQQNSNDYSRNGKVTIKHIDKAKSTLIINTGSSGNINGQKTYKIVGELDKTIQIPIPQTVESYIKFKNYYLSGGDGKLNGLNFTFGKNNSYIDAEYEGSSAKMTTVQSEDGKFVDVTVKFNSIKNSKIDLLGKSELDNDWKVLGSYVDGSYSNIINKKTLTAQNGNTINYTAKLSGIYNLKLKSAGGGQDGKKNGGSGAYIEINFHLNENDNIWCKSSAPGQDSDAHPGVKFGGDGYRGGGQGNWSGGAGGASGASLNGKKFIAAGAGGGGNWAYGYGGRTSTESDVGNYYDGDGFGENAGSSDVGGGGAGFIGGVKGIDQVRGGYGGKTGYDSSLTSFFDIIKEEPGKVGAGRNIGYVELTPVSFDIPITSSGSNQKMRIEILDKKAPEKPSCHISEIRSNNFTVKLDKTKDFGGTYSLQIPGYTNIEDFNYISGFDGWRYAINETPNFKISSNNSTFTNNENLTIANSNNNKFLHLASVDKSGNISETFTIKIINSINISSNKLGVASNSSILRTNDSTSIFIIPMKGFKINNVIVDGKSVGPINSYDFKNVQNDHTVIINFSK